MYNLDLEEVLEVLNSAIIEKDWELVEDITDKIAKYLDSINNSNSWWEDDDKEKE